MTGAFGDGGISEAVEVLVLEPGCGVGGVVIDGAVAVVVEVVAELGVFGEDGRKAVIAVLTGGIAVAVSIGVACGPVAVVVGGVGAVVLAGAGVDVGAGVIAVIAIRDVGVRRLTGGGAQGGVAVAIPVVVRVEGAGVGGVIVHLGVAVIVEFVADLGVSREHEGLAVIAVGGLGAVVGGLLTRKGGGSRVAVAVAIRIVVPGGRV